MCGPMFRLMPRPRKSRCREVQATHLKFLGVTPVTLSLYKKTLHEFFQWRRRRGLGCIVSYEVLDAQVSDYINDLHVRGDPMYKAANVLSGFKRLHPQCKRFLEVSGLYFKNWVRTTPRTRALPLKGEWVKAFFAFASASKRPWLGLLVVLGFLGLLRANELTSLQFS